MGEYLTPQELHHVTGYVRPGQQSDWLKSKAIPFKMDGSRVIVSREHVRAWLEGKPVLARGGLNIAAIR